MRKVSWNVVIVLGLLVGLAWAGPAWSADPRTLEIASKSGVHAFAVEMATTDAERAQGLMNRKELPEGQGMLFDFQRDQEVGFWMKNTYIPLSIAYIDEAGTIVNIADMKPQTTDGHPSTKPAKYALEMNQGWFAKRGIKAGAKINGLRNAPPGQ